MAACSLRQRLSLRIEQGAGCRTMHPALGTDSRRPRRCADVRLRAPGRAPRVLPCSPMSRPGPLRHRFSRRSLLRGLGAGTALLAPFVRNHGSMAQSAPAGAQATPAGNLLIFHTPNGHKRSLVVDGQNTLAFDAASAAGGLKLGRSLMPLQPFQSDVAVIKGLNLKTPTFISSHQDVCRILTCWGAPKEGNDETQFTAFGPSIDQSIGQALNQKPLVVAVFVKDHRAVFDDLFAGLPAPASAPKGNWLDSVRSDIATFGTRVNSQNRAHLDSYLTAVQSLQRKTKL